MEITPERWREVSSLLDEALDLAPGERPAFLADLGARGSATRTLLEDMLRAAEVTGGVLDRPAGEHATLILGRIAADDAEEDPAPVGAMEGTRVGPWRLRREIGRGGMGVVYDAER